VAVDAPAGFNRTFSYSIPSELDIIPGHLVAVPFGARTLFGLVFSIAENPKVIETKEIFNALFPSPILDRIQLDLARWISVYYMAPLFSSASLMLPPGFRSGLKEVLTISQNNNVVLNKNLSKSEKQVLALLQLEDGIERKLLLKLIGDHAGKDVQCLLNNGLIKKNYYWWPQTGKYKKSVKLSMELQYKINETLEQLSKKAPKQAALISYLAKQRSDIVSLSKLSKTFGYSSVKALQKKNLLEITNVQIEEGPLAGKIFPSDNPHELTFAQYQAIGKIKNAINDESDSNKIFLLHGITGSGKTEVYLNAVQKCIKKGKRAIILVPEISLTPQTIERFASRFPGEIAVLHSKLTQSQLAHQWWSIKNGRYRIVIGPRSAVFAPQPNLGLLVIDEEHEWTYKEEEQSPRYHARGIALKIAELNGLTVILGSATPDISTYYHALNGRICLLELPSRINIGQKETKQLNPLDKGLPSVTIVDMRKELRDGNRSIFSRALLSNMEVTLNRGEQIIIFLNRRGSATFVQCKNCGYSFRCRNCAVGLTYHREIDSLLCHYCNKKTLLPKECPKCQNVNIKTIGFGTDYVVESIKKYFPTVKILRWDRDTTKSPKAHEILLSTFQEHRADILVGTQMVAKGLDIPNVTLVGVVSADTGLNLPDFRSGEKAFQLLSQISGRAGRGVTMGTVIIQTFQPDHYAVNAVASQNFLKFYETEIVYRREYRNPPFNRLIRLLYTNANSITCESACSALANILVTERDLSGFLGIDILGPTPSFPSRLKGYYRWHIILRGSKPELLLNKIMVPRGWTIEVDPVTVM